MTIPTARARCVDLNTDSMHCGMCNRGCEGGSTCRAGECTCASGLSYCVNGCVNFQSDPMNCGGCLNACLEGQTCFEGVCRARRIETCNGVDDDFDSSVDEDEQGNTISEDCSNLCGQGERLCVSGSLGECSAPKGNMETCDMRDNDCDGLVDEEDEEIMRLLQAKKMAVVEAGGESVWARLPEGRRNELLAQAKAKM